MVIRKLRKNKPTVKVIIFSVFFGLIVWLLVKSFFVGGDTKQNDNTSNEIKIMQKGENIVVSGNLSSDNQFPLYTHTIKNLDKKNFGLKSANINLNKYIGQVELYGKIDDLYKSMPIIDVDSIKLLNSKTLIKNNNYFFVSDLIFFDFSQDKSFVANKSGDNINVLFGDIHLMSIFPFVCNINKDESNCDKIILKLRNDLVETFTSENGVDYYRYGSGKWIGFNKGMFGYIFDAQDEIILDKSSIISFVDSKYIINNKSQIIKDYCKNDQEYAKEFPDLNLLYNVANNELSVIVDIQTDLGNTYTCNLLIDIWKDRYIKDAVFERKL